MTLKESYEWTQTGCDALLIAAYALTIYQVVKSTKFSFLVQLLVLLLVSNLAGILVIEADTKFSVTDNNVALVWKIIQAVAIFIRNATFNYALWLFAFQYYTLSRYTPFYLKQQNPPEDMTSYDEKVNKLLTYANVIVPLIQAILLFNANLYVP
jgi:hypothetical protein